MEQDNETQALEADLPQPGLPGACGWGGWVLRARGRRRRLVAVSTWASCRDAVSAHSAGAETRGVWQLPFSSHLPLV